MTTVVNRGLSKELRSIYILMRYLGSSRKIIIRLEVIRVTVLAKFFQIERVYRRRGEGWGNGPVKMWLNFYFRGH